MHALLGENGAGKSTLINLLSGVLQPDRGAITFAGRNPGALSPAQARALGIAVVQQELSLAPHLSVAENIALGAMPSRGGFIDFTTLAADAARLGRQLGLDVPLDLPVEALPLGRRQLVEIAKAMWRRPKVLILDEPTSSLTGHEVRMLFGLLRELKREGVAILYISHRLNEVLELCDWVTVLRDGVRTADQSLAGSDPGALVRLMVGRDPGDLFPRWERRSSGTVALSARGLVAEGVAGVDLEVRYGEVLGLGGLLGQGQEETLLALYGDLPRRGEVLIDGAASAPRSPMRANRRGIAYVPADRKREALLLPLPIRFNLVLPSLRRLARRGFRRLAAEAAQRGPLDPRVRDPHRRPVATDAVSLGWQSAEGRDRPLVAAPPAHLPAQRSDARRRRRDQARDLPAPATDGGRWRRRGAAELRYARAGPCLRPGGGVPRGPGGGHPRARRPVRRSDRRGIARPGRPTGAARLVRRQAP